MKNPIRASYEKRPPRVARTALITLCIIGGVPSLLVSGYLIYITIVFGYAMVHHQGIFGISS